MVNTTVKIRWGSIPRWRRYRVRAAGAVLVLVIGVGGGIGFLATRAAGPEESGVQPPSSPDPQALARYEAAIAPLIEEGGFLVAMGMRPGVHDIAAARFDRMTLERMALGWVSGMRSLRSRFAEVDVAGVEDIAGRFDAALEAYVTLARELLKASRTTGDEQAHLLDGVSALGQQADRLFDEAQAALQERRRAFDVGRSPHLDSIQEGDR